MKSCIAHRTALSMYSSVGKSYPTRQAKPFRDISLTESSSLESISIRTTTLPENSTERRGVSWERVTDPANPWYGNTVSITASDSEKIEFFYDAAGYLDTLVYNVTTPTGPANPTVDFDIINEELTKITHINAAPSDFDDATITHPTREFTYDDGLLRTDKWHSGAGTERETEYFYSVRTTLQSQNETANYPAEALDPRLFTTVEYGLATIASGCPGRINRT